MSVIGTSTTIPSECEKPYELTGHQMVGLAFITEGAYLSITADTFVFLLIFNNLRRHNYRLSSIFQTPIDIYIVSLILSDLFQGIGSALIVRWIQLGHVYCGNFCTIQGTFQSLGETSSAMATLVIAIHTFWVIAFRRPPISKGLWVPLLVVSFIWSYVIIFIVIVASRPGNWNAPDPYWCWIGHEHLAAQLAGEYIWLWLATLASIVLYVPLFFILKGWIGSKRDRDQERHEYDEQVRESIDRDLEEKFKREHEERLEQAYVHHTDISIVTVRKDGASHTTMPTMDSHFASPLHRPTSLSPPLSDIENASDHSDAPSISVAPPTPRQKSIPRHSHSSFINEEPLESDSNTPNIPTSYGLRILLYPIAYTALVLPLSVARWSSGFSTSSTTHTTSARTTFVAAAIYYFTGFVNAFLVLFTRRSVSLLSPPQKDDDDEENVMGIGARVDGIPTPLSRASVEEDEKREFGINNSGVGPGSIHTHSQTQGRSRSGTTNSERRIGSAASGSASGTTTANISARQEDEHRNRLRRKKSKSITSDSNHIDMRIRTVEVRGEAGLPD